MKIEVTQNGITVLIPDDGMAIANGTTVSTSKVYIGKQDTPENWRDCELSDEAQTEDYRNALADLGVRLE